MNCAVCGAKTETGKAYLMPQIVKVNGWYLSVVTCSKVCREDWRNDNGEQLPERVCGVDEEV